MYEGLWRFDEGEFSFDRDGSTAPILHHMDSLLGSYFLSGYSDEALNIWGDGNEAKFVVTGITPGGEIYHRGILVSEMDKYSERICLSGPIIESPSLLSYFCESYPSSTIYVCPLVHELDSFGVCATHLNKDGHKPFRANLYHPNYDEIPDSIEDMEFDDGLEGDALGRMAHIVGNGVPVLNEIRIPVGCSPFYGKIISDRPLGEMGFYAIKGDLIDLYFPYEPVSLKYYASATAFVEVKNTEKFKEVSGYEGETLSILNISDYIYDLPTFIKFYVLIAKTGFVAINESELIKGRKTVPVFRYNKGYRVNAKSLKKLGGK